METTNAISRPGHHRRSAATERARPAVTRWRTVFISLVAVVVIAASCGTTGGEPTAPATSSTTAPAETPQPADNEANDTLEVMETVVQGEGSQEISVWAPEGEGSWPLVYVLHGLSPGREAMAISSAKLAAQGAVVFAADWRQTTGTTSTATDVECGYQVSLQNAKRFGADLEQPITLVGWSAGSVLALIMSLDEAATGLRGAVVDCPIDSPRADVVVSIAGCLADPGVVPPMDPAIYGWGNTDASLVLIAGELDTACEPWQSADVVGGFEAAGYDVSLREIPGADHGAMVFLPADEQGSHPPGDATVQIVAGAIERAAG